ncbi:MAG: hypothetical protein RTU30_03035 [Candidatus Thorarchaeota archaeon]
MALNEISLHLLQLPTEGYSQWLDAMSDILNIFLALSIRGYLILILVGMMVYVTGVSDGTAKILVGAGVVLYFVGPFILDIIAGMAGVAQPTIEQATSSWLHLVGMTDADTIALIVTIGDILLAVCVLAGAILYFTPSSNDLMSRGRSLIVRGLMLAPVLVFFHVAPWI